MKSFNLAVIPGDGIGPEVVGEGLKVLDAVAKKYDLVFTSPPFYTKEVYNNMIEWKSIKEFMTEFLKPLIKKSAKYLLQNGHLVLYIEDTNTEEFIPLMKEYALTQDLFYEGAFYYEGSGGTLKPYYVWLKK